MRFGILGPLQVVDDDGRELPVGSRTLCAVLAILLVHRGEVVSSDRLAEELWAGEPPATAAKSLQVHVSRLRSALAKGAGARDRLETVGGGYRLRVEVGELDAERFEQLVDEAGTLLSSGEAGKAIDAFTAALSLWRGAPLSDFEYDSFAQAEIARLSEMQVGAVEQRIAAALALGREAQVIGELERLVRAHPFRERLRGQLMLALYRSGRQADALGAYRGARSALVDELGIEPSAELRSLHESILAQDPSLLRPADARARGAGQTTMLFGAIEDAARLERELGDRWTQASTATSQVMRDAWAAAGGEEVWCEGGAALVVFRSASAAVAAATAAQLALRQLAWPDGRPQLVRMAIHTGEPEVRDGTYLGVDVQYLERLAGAAHGGQVLLSAATRTLVTDADVDDLSEHALRDFPTPRRVFHLRIGGAGSEGFPPPRTLAQARSNLPSIMTPLVGRDAELDDLRSRLTDSPQRLVTITGAGGMGKTRLAIACGAALQEKFADGVYLVSLAPVPDATGVAAAIAEAVQAPRVAELGAEGAVLEHLRERRVLLVIDNLEHVLDAAPLLSRLAEGAPGVRVLATSQAPLRLSAESVVPLDALALPEPGERDARLLAQIPAVQLFIERARAAYPAFSLADDNAAAVGELCRELDGLPLALELAAARLRLAGVDLLIASLRKDTEALGRGTRDMPARQRGLRAALDWTVSLLEPEQRELFAGLGVFADAWTLDQAESVSGQELDTWEAMAALMDFSLIQTRGDGRLTMAERVRRHARELLAAGGREHELRSRHAQLMAATAERLDAELQLDISGVIVRTRDALDDFELALSWSQASDPILHRRLVAALGRPFYFVSRLPTLRMALDQLADPDDRSDSIAGRLLSAQGMSACLAQDMERAVYWTGAAVECQRVVGTLEELVDAISFHSHMLTLADRGAEARASIADGLKLAANHPDHRARELLEGTLAFAAVAEGEFDEAEARIAELLAAPGRTDFAAAAAMSYWADCALGRGEGEAALERYAASLRDLRGRDAINASVQMLGIAASLAMLGLDGDVAELLGGVERMGDEHDIVSPDFNLLYERLITAAQQRLDAAEWARRHAIGHARESDEAVDWALERATSISAGSGHPTGLPPQSSRAPASRG